jgi:DNA-binding NarL/FixJ family response regulator
MAKGNSYTHFQRPLICCFRLTRHAVRMVSEYKSAFSLRVYLVEDSDVIREHLTHMIKSVPGLDVIGGADHAEAAIADIESLQPDAVIVDIQIVNGSGLDVLSQVRKRVPGLRSIVLTNFASSQHRKRAAEIGSDYFLDKSNEFKRITPILEKWRNDKLSVSPG